MTLPRTEHIETRYRGLDLWSSEQALTALADGQIAGATSVKAAIPAIARAAEGAAAALAGGGRLIYLGAGSSGLIALIDALEIPQTFGIAPDRILVLMAGGLAMTVHLTGGPEDDPALGISDVKAAGVGPGDYVVAASASGSTPYTLAGIEAARAAGAKTAAMACNEAAPLFAHADVAIWLDSGPEVLAGSTRMAAGTAQKAAFNMLSTLIAIRLGHVVDGMMVNVQADNTKLVGRAARIVARLADTSTELAERALRDAGGHVKPAILVARGLSTPEAAQALIDKNNGNVRAALAELAKADVR